MSLTSPTAANPNPADTLTLSDLEQWSRRDAAGNFLPSLAVLGHPVAHSVSPRMHNAALAELAKKHPQLQDWKYFKFDVEPENLKKAIALLPVKKFQGTNLTVPHKVAALELVEAGVDAKSVGAINTVDFSLSGALGFNTDTFGLQMALREDLNAELSGKDAVLLGSGGAARAAALQCLQLGCRRLWIGSRKPEAEMGKTFAAVPVAKFFQLSNPPVKDWPDDVLVINATSLGLNAADPLPMDINLLPSRARVFDMVYQRNGTTKFVAAARDRGLRATDGLGMLVWQGAAALNIWLSRGVSYKDGPNPIAAIMLNAIRHA